MTTEAPSSRRRILVTGVGGAPGFDLARSLLRLGCEVIATDADPLAPGLWLPCVTARTSAPASDPGYDAGLLALCRELHPDAMMSTVEAEAPRLVALSGALAALGVRTWLPEMPAVLACLDKAAFAAVLRDHRLPAPRTWLPHELGQAPDGCALVVKPRRGHGAQGVHFCSTRRHARVLCELVDDPIVQERVHGAEFTADCLVDREGRASVVLRHRLLVKGGLSVVSRTFADAEATALVKKVLAAVGAAGACCAQGFIREHGPQRVVMTEVNARVAGGFPLAEAAGADLVGQALRGLFGLPVDHARLVCKPGVYLTKYTETLTVGERDTPAVPHQHRRPHPSERR